MKGMKPANMQTIDSCPKDGSDFVGWSEMGGLCVYTCSPYIKTRYMDGTPESGIVEYMYTNLHPKYDCQGESYDPTHWVVLSYLK